MNPAPEAIRLVIWDLDETFWHGTLTEGGVTWREEAERAVRTLAVRGIVSAICSKNDPVAIEEILTRRGVAEFFVFNSVSWDAKGPRLAALIRAVQLRPPSVLFIDDNPANLAEALHFVPGLQVADHTIIDALLDDARCLGKPDPGCTRLAQYRLLEQRQRDEAAGGDAQAFLRASGITVRIEHDVEAHLDRAIELINRTNQLNFTKSRLPEAPDAARGELRALLGEHTVQAGLVHVRDTYGDHGLCGIYVLRNHRRFGRALLHFAFSCRILGMGVETWLYNRLGRPALSVVGEVVSDVLADRRQIDWISTDLAGRRVSAAGKAPMLSYVLARGGCDMRALSHYFGLVADRVFEEFDTVRDGQAAQVNHSMIAVQAMRGMDADAVADFAPLGFRPEDFKTTLAGDLPNGPAVWLLSFAVECQMPVYRHRASGALLPAYVPGLGRTDPGAFLRGASDGEVAPALASHMREAFDYEGVLPDAAFQDNLRLILARAGKDVRVFVLLGNTRFVGSDGQVGIAHKLVQQNTCICEIASAFENVETLAPLDFMSAQEIAALVRPHHYERMVYFRMFQHIMSRLPN